ncbi:hypothetical protein [Caldalkalibacillus mannanilyticus]|uniref:hypothetical protein n=1 Tax=Caldalkalibacillus mannanilyticus TaxID=1418 RepID=UPI000469B298|nr:hypothetical protein [Caldalkalibacillus mannanilyticus]
MNEKEIIFFKILFIIAALWNLIGAIFGYFNTAYTFNLAFDRELVDPLFYAVYKGSWGTTLVYFFGYLIVAYNPVKHTGIVILGGIGKVGFIITLIQLYLAGIATSVAFIVIIGDFIFFLLFLYYFYKLFKSNIRII